jgi:hypothetical protein
MKAKWLALMVLLVFLTVPMTAMALPFQSFNILYVDASGHVIGESLTYCNGVVHKAGATSAYYISIAQGCGNVVCTSDSSCGRDYSRDFGINLPDPNADWDSSCLLYFRQICNTAQVQRWYGTMYGFPEPSA